MMLEKDDLPCFVSEVRDEVSKLLQLPSEDWMQDWPIEVTDSKRIKDFVEGYALEDRTEHRSAIATLIIASLDDALGGNEPVSEVLLAQIAVILKQHPELLGYWARPDSESSMEEFLFSVSPWIRSLGIMSDAR
ncbi:hypothetical protein [Luteolibacter sp. Populi]|uniref:hypothetical protein n=1 Tax=Luteolibacter sp. Populi TaxID=3230487 RepID=UPI003464E91E